MPLLYTPFKIFHYPEKIDSLSPDEQKVASPIHVRIKPINVCNHNCWYCAYRADNLQLGESMNLKDQIPENKMNEIIEDLIDMDVKAITFSGGGEPFLYKPLSRVIRRLAESSVQFASLTNGSRLQGEIAELFAFHATWLRISLDGWDDKSYAKYRRVRLGEFSDLLIRIRNFVKLKGTCYLGVNLNVDQENASHVREIVIQLREAGAQSVKISPCIVSNDASESQSYHQPIFAIVRSQIEKLKKDVTDSFELHDSYHNLDSKFDKTYDWCPYLQILTVIGADVNVYSCQDKAYNLREGLLGSLSNQSFRQFWENDRDKFFRIYPPKDCQHHCVSNKKNEMLWEYTNSDKNHLAFI